MAWFGTITLANMIYHKNADPNRWPRVFSHYFNGVDQPKVDKAFSLLVGEGEQEDPNGGAAFMKDIFITNHPPPEHEHECDQAGLTAYTFKIDGSSPKWVIVLCDWAYRFPVSSETGCDKLGDNVSGMMDTLDGIILHELM
jgi:hypothetical protein